MARNSVEKCKLSHANDYECKAYLKRCLERPAYDMIQDMKVTTYMEWIKEIDNCFNPCTSDKVKAALQPLAGNTLTQKKT